MSTISLVRKKALQHIMVVNQMVNCACF